MLQFLNAEHTRASFTDESGTIWAPIHCAIDEGEIRILGDGEIQRAARAFLDQNGDEAALPYVAPSPTFPPLSPRQLRLMILQIGLTDADVEAQIAAIPDPTERAAASIEWQWATRYDRTHPLVATLATALEFTDAELDALWAYAADL